MPSPQDILRLVSQAEQAYSNRWNAIRDARDIRYGRDDVISTIPEELRSTDFEYHSMSMNRAVLDLTAFLTAGTQVWMVNPSKEREQNRADAIENVLTAIFGPNGILEREAGNEVGFTAWQNQCENGDGIYKLTLKRDYVGTPIESPQRVFTDDSDPFDGITFIENPNFNRHSRLATRSERAETRLRETDASLDQRRRQFMEDLFPWQYRSPDPEHFFHRTSDGIPLISGEISRRPVTVLEEHGLSDLMNIDNGFVFFGEDDGHGRTPRVHMFEAWTDTHGYIGVMSHSRQENGRREIRLSNNAQIGVWAHPYRRIPYFHAAGLENTDRNPEFRLAGAFDQMLSEIPLLNHLETMHFNATHRGFFPLYQLVADKTFRGDTNPLEAEQLQIANEADMQQAEAPPGYKWDIMPSGFEPEVGAQLQAARERVENSAIAAVLSGTSPGAGDSGAKISLLINAAARAISPFVRHHEGPLDEMAEMLLDTSRRLQLDLNVTIDDHQPDGRVRTKTLKLEPKDIISTAATVRIDIALPVDAAAQETRGITLIDNNKMSYETAAPKFFGVGDPKAEQDRIRLGRRDGQIDDIAFQQSTLNFQERAPQIFAEFIGNAAPLESPPGTVGGGPQGAFGGASALLGRGSTASPSAGQADVG